MTASRTSDKALPQGEDKSLKPSEDKTRAVAERTQTAVDGVSLPLADSAPAPKTTVTVVLAHYVDGVLGPDGAPAKPGDSLELEPRLATSLIAGAAARLPEQ